MIAKISALCRATLVSAFMLNLIVLHIFLFLFYWTSHCRALFLLAGTICWNYLSRWIFSLKTFS